MIVDFFFVTFSHLKKKPIEQCQMKHFKIIFLMSSVYVLSVFIIIFIFFNFFDFFAGKSGKEFGFFIFPRLLFLR